MDTEDVSEKSPLTLALAFLMDLRLIVYSSVRPDSRTSALPPKTWVMIRVVPPSQTFIKPQAKM